MSEQEDRATCRHCRRQLLGDFFGDTSRPASQTKEDLQGLIDEIEMLIESLPDEES